VPELSVASLNTHAGMDGWGWRYDLGEACRQLDADVIALQEIFAPLDGASQADEISAQLGYTPVELPLSRAWRRREGIEKGRGWQPRTVFPTTLKAIRVGGRVDYAQRASLAGYEEGTWGLAVLSRPKVASTEAVELGRLRRDFTRRGALIVGLDVGAGQATAAAAATTPTTADGGGGSGEGSFTIIATHGAHLTAGSPWQLRRLYAQMPTRGGPAAFAGDMNMWGPPLSLLLPGWRRAVRGRTWPAWRPHSQTDHILVNRAVTVVAGEVLRVGNSDHLAVRAELRW